MTIRKKDLTAICVTLHDGFIAAERTIRENEDVAKIYSTQETTAEHIEKQRVRRLHIYHDTARDVGKTLSEHNPTFDLERFIRHCMPKKGEL